MAKTIYKMYVVDGLGGTWTELYKKSDLKRYQSDKKETLFECAEIMVDQFNWYRRKGEPKRYVYKLEKVVLIGSQEYYDLNIGSKMCEVGK